MVKVETTYTAETKTELNLSDGSFIDPEIVRKWMTTAIEGDNLKYRDRMGYDLSSLYQGLNDIVYDPEFEVNEGDRLMLNIEGIYDPSHLETAMLILHHDNTYETRAEAKAAELRGYQEQAFASYRLADHMTAAAKRLDDFYESQQRFEKAKADHQAVKNAL